MKPFDLELAKQGHPLVTMAGGNVVFLTAERDSVEFPILCLVDGRSKSYTIRGFFHAGSRVSSRNLFLADCDWQPPLKEGDEVEVSGYEDEYEKRIFLYEDANGRAVCFSDTQEDEYNNGGEYVACSWKKWRRVPQPSVEITIKINGKDAKLSDISEETLKKLKQAE